MKRLPVVDLPEDPLARGRLHGERMQASVRANVETYYRRFEAGGLRREEADQLCGEWAKVFSQEAPEYAIEMRGIAEGAGVPLRSIVMVNARYELTYAVISSEAKTRDADFLEPDGCTSFGLMPEVTAAGSALIGQNWDWISAVQDHVFVARVRRRIKPSFVGFTEAGIAGAKMGLNEAGIGLAVNGLVSSEDGNHLFRRPLHVRCHDVMDADRFDQAIAAVIRGKRTGSANVLLGHADGEIINIEATPELCSYIYPRNGIVTHANHLEAETRVASLFEQVAPHTLYRGPRLRRLLERRRGSLDVPAIAACLSDGFGAPNAICRQPDPTLPEPKRVKTVCALVVDFAAEAIHVSAGPPTEAPLVKFPLLGEPRPASL